MPAIILSIGDELALGQVVDTNSVWLSAQLAAIGCEVRYHMTVADSQKDIEFAIRTAAPLCDFLIITGGLGPTQDDLTRQAIAAVLDQPLEMHEPSLTRMTAYFTRLGRPMPPSNTIQAMIPRTAHAIDNPNGTAAGIRATLSPEFLRAFAPSRLRESPCTIFAMPGVPKEMKPMFTNHVLPELKQHAGGAVILSTILHTFGAGESTIGEKLGPLMDRTRNPSVGTTVSNSYVSLRINARAKSPEIAQRELDETIAACGLALGDLIWGRDDESLAQVVGRMLIEKNQTVATAESCTGGLLAKMFTDIPGSSAYFKQGWVTYTNESKHNLLNVPTDLIEKHGAVSECVVESMASNAQQIADSNYALSISGVAGPAGGTPEKPVGTVCIGLSSAPSTPHSALISRTFRFTGDRETIRDRSAKMAMTMLRYHLLEKQMPF